MKGPPKVLIVEDDSVCGTFLVRAMRRMGLTPLLTASLPEAREALARHDARLVILDRRLKAGADGLSLCLDLKKDPRQRHIPVIVLTGMKELEDEIKGLRYGADLYLCKPVDLRLLERYVKAFIDRLPYKGETDGRIVYGGIVLSSAERSLRVGRRIYHDLPPRQFDFLALLLSERGAAVSRRTILRRLWHNRVRDKEIDVLVFRLRQHLGPDAGVIKAVPGRGFRLAPETELR